MVAGPSDGNRTLLWMKAGHRGQLRRQVLAVPIAPFGLSFQTGKLGIEDCALKLSQPIISRDDMVLIPRPVWNPAAVLNRAASRSQGIVVGGDEASFTRREIFARLE